MSRSPWRDALDGQIKIMREIRRDSTFAHLARSANLPELESYVPNINERAVYLLRVGREIAGVLETLVREAEPVYLAHDIVTGVNRDMAREFTIGITEEQIPSLTEGLLPIQHGLIWLGETGMMIESILDDHDPPVPDVAVCVKAIYFGDDIACRIQPYVAGGVPGYEISVYGNEPGKNLGMGITLFLDSVKSGYTNMTKQFGPHLVPVSLGMWGYGVPLHHYSPGQTSLADSVDVVGTQKLMFMTGMFLHTLFRLMQQRVMRWGGVGLTRTESREAEREKLRPRVQLVTWRKANYQYPEGHIPVAKNWSCRWSVRPHIRRYKSGKVVLIDRYVKGPPGKPFRLPAQNVHQVVR